MSFQRIKETCFFAKLKKCWFLKNQVWFLEYVMSAQRIEIEDEEIEAVKNWLEQKSIKEI